MRHAAGIVEAIRQRHRSTVNTEIRNRLWSRITELMIHRYGIENQNRLAREAGVGVATISRLKQSDTSAGLDVMEKVAMALGVEAWQLICPPQLAEGGAPPTQSPMAEDLARSLDAILDEAVKRKAYAVASQVISFGVEQIPVGASPASERITTDTPASRR